MDKAEKLFRKISKKDRGRLYNLIEKLMINDGSLNIIKLKGSDFYRIRQGNFRVIFHYNSREEIIVDSIRLRQENTYKNF